MATSNRYYLLFTNTLQAAETGAETVHPINLIGGHDAIAMVTAKSGASGFTLVIQGKLNHAGAEWGTIASASNTDIGADDAFLIAFRAVPHMRVKVMTNTTEAAGNLLVEVLV